MRHSFPSNEVMWTWYIYHNILHVSGWQISLCFTLLKERKVSTPASSCISDAARQDTDASPCNSIKARSAANSRNQFRTGPGFNRQRWILRCQWVRRRYSRHLREVTADVMRFSALCLSYTSAALNSMKGAGDYVYKCSSHGSLRKMGPLNSACSVS